MQTPLNRRGFVKGFGAAGLTAVASAPLVRAASPNSKVIVGVMGTNGRGQAHARGWAALPGSEVKYICDVDKNAVARGIKATLRAQKKSPTGVENFQQMLDDKDLDLLSIATPNHWHAPAGILACKAGKHVYVEKPCSHNAHESELLVKAARKHNRVVQMGNQRRSWPGIVEAIKLLHEGVIGRIYYSRSWYANTRGQTGKQTKTKTPRNLNFDLWQGPAARQPYVTNLVHYKWHWFWKWGNGELGNNGVHSLDLCRWGMDVDYPTRVNSTGGRYRFNDDQQTPDTHIVSYEFEDKKTIMWEGLSCNRHGINQSGFGCSFHGEKGTMTLTSTGYTLFDRSNKQLKTVPGKANDGLHYQNTLDCIASGKRPNSDIDEGHKSTMLCHLGNIAARTGRTLNCDPKTGRILNDKNAMTYWSGKYAKGWEPTV